MRQSHVSPALKCPFQRLKTALAVSIAAVALAACGGGSDNTATGSDPTPGGGGTGGGGTGGGGTTPASYTVAGQLTLAESNTLDSDTNDPRQPNRTSNNTLTNPQAIASPTTVLGYLNVPNEGPDGPSKVSGDTFDRYSVRLEAGQVVEVEFATNPSDIDVDLFIYPESGTDNVGSSRDQNSYECLRIAETGNYRISVSLWDPGGTSAGSSRGGTVYLMRIGAPGTGVTCNRQTQSLSSLVAGEVIATSVTAGLGDAVTKSTTGRPVVKKGSLDQGRTALLQVPADFDDSAGGGQRAKSLTAQANAGLSEELAAYERTMRYEKTLRLSGQYGLVMPNFTVQTYQTQPLGPFPPNDRDYQKQRWHYESIELPAAIASLNNLSPQPTRAPIVAVLDSGIVADHPDLRGQLVAGFDFIRDATAAGDGNGIDSNPDDAGDSPQSSFHGSHVAGTVAAQTNNSSGGAGVASMARIMPVRALSETGGNFYDIFQSILFAAGLANDSNTVPANRADVINMSLGSGGQCSDDANNALRSVIERSGVIMVAASGNESRSSALTRVGFPANCPSVIAVGAVDAQSRRAKYSNGGPNLSVVAPGGDTSQSTTGSGLPDGVYSTVASFSRGSRVPSYAMLNGTSMASPHAAGIFALMRFVNPSITQVQIESLITSGQITRDLGPSGRDNSYGYGLLSARKAVDMAGGSGSTQPPAPAGRIEASPSTLNLGQVRSTVEFVLRAVGTTGTTVTRVASDSPLVTVAPKSGEVSATTGLGTYVVTSNRSELQAGASSFPNIVVTLSSGDPVSIPVSIQSPPTGSAGGGDLGPIYVIVVDADDENLAPVRQAVSVAPQNGVYSYRVDAVPGTQRILVFAGSDTDNDGFICNRGEACGAFPVLGSSAEVIQPTNNLTGVDFSLAPFGGISSQAVQAAVSGIPTQGFAVGGARQITGIRRMDK